jgi:hypothetical protein
VKTWLATLNPQGGTVVGQVDIDGTVVATSTFTGTRKVVFEVGMPNVTTGKHIHVVYTSSTPFKHYESRWEFEPKPYLKTTWLVTYKKAGGATQMDMARWSDVELEGTATVTSTWLIDSTAVSTQTLTVSGRQYFDQLSFPPGARGYIFQQQVTSTQPFRVWRSNLDIERIGIKGFSRATYAGTPTQSGQGDLTGGGGGGDA